METAGEFPWVAVIVAVLGAGGVGAFVNSIVGSISKLGNGVALKEEKRKTDIAAQRDDAYAREAVERERADAAERNVRRMSDYSRDLRGILIEDYRVKKAELPKWPTLEDVLEAETTDTP